MGEKGEIISNSYLSLLSTPKNDGAFNIYDDVRDKLAAKGIPKEEISFIHEAKTEVQKEGLFAKVRSGQVRILLGSTQKMGAGTNIQDRLIALHHLDCPWKPSDLEQREGRIIRRGNQNKKVKIFRYVVKNTFDAYLWQIVENKQKFISQIMTGKSPVRSCEDVDDTALSYAEIKALATGNPYIREKMDLDIKVSRLKLFKANHTSQKYQLEEQIARNFPAQIAALKERIGGLKSDAEAINPVRDSLADADGFEMTVSGRSFTDRREAGTALIAACRSFKTAGAEGRVGEFHGFSISGCFEYINQKYMLTLKRQRSYRLEAGQDPLGNILRICNALAGIGKRLAEAEQNLETVQQQLLTAQEEVEKPFPKESELAAGLARLAELNCLLNLDDGGAETKTDCPDRENEETCKVAETSGAAVYGEAGGDSKNLRMAETRKGNLKADDAVEEAPAKARPAGWQKMTVPADHKKTQDAGSRHGAQKVKKRMEPSL